MTDVVLVTGATGYLGKRAIRALLERDDSEVLALVRASSDDALEGRRRALAEELRASNGRLSVMAVDLEDPSSFEKVDVSRVTHILHAAAITRFNVDAQLATRVNLEGSRAVFELGRRCPRLRSFGHVSSLYACGLVQGRIEERPFLARPAFANEYERSKHEAERLLLDEHGDLPWRILRVATVIADDERGAVGQHNAFHNTLRLLFYGLLSLAPGDPAVPLYLVTGDFAARALVELTLQGERGGVYHVAPSREESPTLGSLLQLAWERFQQEEDFRARNVLQPLFCDEESFRLLSREADAFGSGVLAQGLASVRSFAAQLFLEKDARNDRLQGALSSYRVPDPATLLERTCAHLVKTRWGRRAA